MNVEDVKKVIESLRGEGYTDEEIASAFYGMFQKDEVSLDDLKDMVGLVGFELTEEFLDMSPEDQKTKGYEEESAEPEESEEDKEKKFKELFGLN